MTIETRTPKSKKTQDIAGQRFGRLMAISFVRWEKGRYYWECLCDCSAKKLIGYDHLRDGTTLSCGCLSRDNTRARSVTHGKTYTPEWEAWCSIKKRCLNPNHKFYRRYGGRGITICDRWLGSFEAFLEDMGEKPGSKLSLDRIDNDKGYFKENCRWATQKEQTRNTAFNRHVEYKGRKMVLAEAIDLSSLPYTLVLGRLRYGWTIERALETPHNKKPRKGHHG